MSLLGVSIPLEQIAYGTAGFVAAPLLASYVKPMLPASWFANNTGKVADYALRVGIVVGGTLLVKQFAGSEAAKNFLVGGGINVAAKLIYDFAPTGWGVPAVGYYPTSRRWRGGRIPMPPRYIGPPVTDAAPYELPRPGYTGYGSGNGATGTLTGSVARLNPSSRL